jgi:hypothetical protein
LRFQLTGRLSPGHGPRRSTDGRRDDIIEAGLIARYFSDHPPGTSNYSHDAAAAAHHGAPTAAAGAAPH